jgi:coenzyme F420-dependent glucose-6-phosphate dehydrogenase
VAARWGDGIWTVPDPESTPDLLDAWRDAGGSGEVVLQALFSWARDGEAAFESVRKWKGAQPREHYTQDWHRPRKMYEHGEQQISDEELAKNVIVGSDLDEHASRIRELEQLGATVIVLQNNSGADPLGAIRAYGEHVLPALRGVRV